MIDRKYQNYFLRIVYVAFMEYIINSIGIARLNNILKQEYMFDGRKGINPKISKLFRRFLESNKAILKTVAANGFKVFTPKNICGGELRPPINCENDEMMIREGLRSSTFIIDKTVFEKTDYEKERIKREKHITKLSSDNFIFRDIHRKSVGCLIVHLLNSKHERSFKTTFNYKCAKHEVIDIITIFHTKDFVKKVMFNGKEIK